MKEHSEYHIKYLGIEYIIQIYTIEDIYYVESKTKERKEIYYTIVNTNIKVEKIHPGYLIPTIDTIRDIKIDKIIN